MDRNRIITIVEAEIMRQESKAMLIENEGFGPIYHDVAEALRIVLETYEKGD